MKSISLTLALAMCGWLAFVPMASASAENGPLAVVVDAAIVRPASLVVAVVGAGLFVATLPFSVPSKSVKRTAEVLIAAPGRAAFTRPLGDLDALYEADFHAAHKPTARSESPDSSDRADLPDSAP